MFIFEWGHSFCLFLLFSHRSYLFVQDINPSVFSCLKRSNLFSSVIYASSKCCLILCVFLGVLLGCSLYIGGGHWSFLLLCRTVYVYLHFFQCCLLCLGALVFGSYVFIIVISSWWIDSSYDRLTLTFFFVSCYCFLLILFGMI